MTGTAAIVPVTAVIPTIGRVEPLRRCLESLASSEPAPAEILVVDQSHDAAIPALVAEVGGTRTRVVPSHGLGVAAAHPGAIVTGRVLPIGDPRAVPSTKDDPLSADLSGERRGGWLFGNNMALPRAAVLELGGFDERFGPEEAAEDNEFCYRWLRAGRMLRYEPTLVVEHHDWRSPEDLERLYVR